uniref:HDC11835 n=1 Tax=Drosophila melanogaster TaxID=7227 RepID=Q6IKR0_DROME|nr:TPA_inf: HDC11835 [Drosophila melanogaster]
MIKVKGRGKDDLVKGTWRRRALRAEPFVNGRSADCMFRTHNPLHLETYDRTLAPGSTGVRIVECHKEIANVGYGIWQLGQCRDR